MRSVTLQHVLARVVAGVSVLVLGATVDIPRQGDLPVHPVDAKWANVACWRKGEVSSHLRLIGAYNAAGRTVTRACEAAAAPASITRRRSSTENGVSCNCRPSVTGRLDLCGHHL
jgi:hypothetical protein